MAHRSEILGALHRQGIEPIQVAGWQTRGSAIFDPRGSVNHHTAGPRLGNHPSLNVLINGRGKPGDKNYLPGPLCNVSLARNGSVYLIAAGRANHAGAGGWNFLTGNSSVWGLEVEHTGNLATEASPSAEQFDKMYRIHAAFADVSGFDASYVCQHFEWTKRKIDFIGVNGAKFRNAVQHQIDRSRPTPAPPSGGDEMALNRWLVWAAPEGDLRIYVTNGVTKKLVNTKTQQDIIRYLGQAEYVRDFPKPGDWLPFNWTKAQIASVPDGNV